jgi:hypothetical protein
LKAAKPTPFDWPKAYLVDRPTGTAFVSAGEVADWMDAQAKARGPKSHLLDRFRKAVKK